ncbi:unc119b [Symbiodinium sp. CCMP2592]|nr:unc119b [Symbiodinium sp. CCMP2592]
MAMVDLPSEWHEEAAETHAEMYEVTPEYVNLLTAPTESYLCDLEHNIYNLQFVDFRIRSLDEGNEGVLFDLGAGDRPSPIPPELSEVAHDTGPGSVEEHGFLDIQTIGTTLEFTNGDYEVQNFRMIERHYFRDQLITSYDFTMPFVIPNTRNTWEMIYTKPELSDEWKEALISSPWEVRSDSFYFVDGRLVMHNRAEYNYGY